MSFHRILTTAIRDAGIAKASFDAAIKREGFKSRFDWFLKAPASLQEAYNLRVAADKSDTVLRGRAARSARVAHNHEVVGSNPTPATSSRGSVESRHTAPTQPGTSVSGYRAKNSSGKTEAAVARGPREAFRKAVSR